MIPTWAALPDEVQEDGGCIPDEPIVCYPLAVRAAAGVLAAVAGGHVDLSEYSNTEREERCVARERSLWQRAVVLFQTPVTADQA